MAVTQTYTKGQEFELRALETMIGTGEQKDPKFSRTGYHFKNWTDGEQNFQDKADVTFISEITNLSAVWDKNQYKLTFTPSSTEGIIRLFNQSGTTEYNNGTSVDYETPLSVLVEANSGYELNTLTMNGTDIKQSRTFTVPAEDMTIVATWNDIEGTVFFHPGY